MSRDNCIFCGMQDVILQNDLAYVTYDTYPVSPGHCVVIPFRHIPSYFETTQEEKLAILELIDTMKKLLDRERKPDGYNIGVNIGQAAGQSIMHLHVHIIPRYFGDMENPKGGVRGVIPDKQKYSTTGVGDK